MAIVLHCNLKPPDLSLAPAYKFNSYSTSAVCLSTRHPYTKFQWNQTICGEVIAI